MQRSRVCSREGLLGETVNHDPLVLGGENGLNYRWEVMLQEEDTRLTVGASNHCMVFLSNFAIGSCLKRGFHSLDKTHRLSATKPDRALKMLASPTLSILARQYTTISETA